MESRGSRHSFGGLWRKQDASCRPRATGLCHLLQSVWLEGSVLPHFNLPALDWRDGTLPSPPCASAILHPDVNHATQFSWPRGWESPSCFHFEILSTKCQSVLSPWRDEVTASRWSKCPSVTHSNFHLDSRQDGQPLGPSTANLSHTGCPKTHGPDNSFCMKAKTRLYLVRARIRVIWNHLAGPFSPGTKCEGVSWSAPQQGPVLRPSLPHCSC